MNIIVCWFCGSNVYPGHGSLYVKNTCDIFYFCRSKCKKSFMLRKNPFFIKWCLNYRQTKGKCLSLSHKNIHPNELFTKLPNNYNNFILKFMFYILKRSSRKLIKKNLVYKNIIKNKNIK